MMLGAARIASWLRERKPDVLFAHLNGPSRAAILARELARVPTRIVVVEHTHYSTFGWKHGWLRAGLTSLLYRRADRVAGVSPAVIEDLVTCMPGIRGRTALLPAAGPDPGELAVSCREPPEHPWYHERTNVRLICSVGNLVPRKGQDTLIEALPAVRDALGDVRLILVGRFDDREFQAHLERRAAELRVREHVDFVGYRADARPYIAHAHVFAHASWTEGFSIVLAEALACGTPVVATRCPGGPSYVLDEGRCGMLVPVRDPAAMARGISSVLADQELRSTLIANGRERAARFSPSAVAEEYFALAEECMTEPPAARPPLAASMSG